MNFTYSDEGIQSECEPEIIASEPDPHSKGGTGEEREPLQVPPGLKRKCTRCGHYNDGNAFSCTKCQQALYRKFDERGVHFGGPQQMGQRKPARRKERPNQGKKRGSPGEDGGSKALGPASLEDY